MAEHNLGDELRKQFPANTHHEHEKPAKKKIEPVIRGTVSLKKKGICDQLAETFLGDNLKNIASYIGKEVLLPIVRDALSDIGHGAIDTIFFGESSGGSSYRSLKNRKKDYIHYDKVSYHSEYDSDRERRQERTSQRPSKFDDIILETRGDAEDVIFSLVELIDEHDQASVADLYQLVGITGDFTDVKWGWTNLSTAKPVRLRGGKGYLLDLPKPILLDY